MRQHLLRNQDFQQSLNPYKLYNAEQTTPTKSYDHYQHKYCLAELLLFALTKSLSLPHASILHPQQTERV